MHGNYTAIMSMQESDLLVALGSRFDDRVTGRVPEFAPLAKIIHVDIDPAELGKVRRPDVPIVGDCRLVMELVKAVRSLDGGRSFPDRRPWHAKLSGWQERNPLAYEPSLEGESLNRRWSWSTSGTPCRRTPPVLRCRSAPDVGSQYWRFRHPYTWVNSGGLGTMGFAVPRPSAPRSAARTDGVGGDGDGCFQMTAQEGHASAERIPVKIAILNNAYLGMVRQWQEMFYGERYSEVYLSPDLPDYVKWAEAMGCVAVRVESPEEIQPDPRQGKRDRRPAGRGRVPHRFRGEGVPDGRGRRVEQRCPSAPRSRRERSG